MKSMLKQFKKDKESGILSGIKIQGAGVASISSKDLLKSKRVSNVVEKIQGFKHNSF